MGKLFLPDSLVVGGRLHLIKEYEPDQILKTIFRHKISWINCTPSAFYALIERGNDLSLNNQSFRQLRSLRYLFLGGEPISISRRLPFLDSEHFDAKVVNTYGPTECTDICASYVIAPDFTDEVVPIGRPL